MLLVVGIILKTEMCSGSKFFKFTKGVDPRNAELSMEVKPQVVTFQ